MFYDVEQLTFEAVEVVDHGVLREICLHIFGRTEKDALVCLRNHRNVIVTIAKSHYIVHQRLERLYGLPFWVALTQMVIDDATGGIGFEVVA